MLEVKVVFTSGGGVPTARGRGKSCVLYLDLGDGHMGVNIKLDNLINKLVKSNLQSCDSVLQLWVRGKGSFR